jgi:hypothetical protein
VSPIENIVEYLFKFNKIWIQKRWTFLKLNFIHIYIIYIVHFANQLIISIQQMHIYFRTYFNNFLSLKEKEKWFLVMVPYNNYILWKWMEIIENNWMYWGLRTLDNTPEDGTRSAETYVGTKCENRCAFVRLI